MNTPLALSVVIPVYKNAGTVDALYARLTKVLEESNIQFEIVFVDDACPQGSLVVLRRLTEKDPRVAVLAMAQNVGQQRAVLAGLDVSDGQAVSIMDADLQDPPEAIPSLLEKLSGGYDVVFAGRRGNYEAGIRLFTSRLYKWTLHLLTGLPRDAGLFLVARHDVVRKIVGMNAQCPHLVAMFGALGVHSMSIPVERAPRPSGITAYTSWMRLRMGLTAALWAFSWHLGIRPHTRGPVTGSPVRERIGKKFQ